MNQKKKDALQKKLRNLLYSIEYCLQKEAALSWRGKDTQTLREIKTNLLNAENKLRFIKTEEDKHAS